MNPVGIYLLNACAMPGTLLGIEINVIKTNKQTKKRTFPRVTSNRGD